MFKIGLGYCHLTRISVSFVSNVIFSDGQEFICKAPNLDKNLGQNHNEF